MALQDVQILFPAQNDPGLGAAQQLVAGKGQHVHPGPYGRLDGGFIPKAQGGQVHQTAAAQVLNDRDVPGVPQLRQGGGGDAFREAHDAVVAGVDLQQGLRPVADGGGIVGKAGLIGGPYLPQHRAAGGHDIRHPEGPADLHQLPPGGDDLPTGGEGGEDQQHRCGVVVHNQGGLRSGETAQQRLHMGIPLAPLPGGQVVFQGGIAPGGVCRRGQSPPAETGPAQVGVEYHAGGVDDAPEGGQPGGPADFGNLSAEGAFRRQLRDGPCQDIRPESVQSLPDSFRHGGRRDLRRQRLQGGTAQQIIHLGDLAQQLFFHREPP